MRRIPIDFEHKRYVTNGDYHLTHADTSPLFIPNCLVFATDGSTFALIANLSNDIQTISRGQTVGKYESVKGMSVTETDLSLNNDEPNGRLNCNSDILRDLCTLYEPDERLTVLKFNLGEIKIGDNLTTSEKDNLIALLTEFKDVMAFDGRLGRTDLIEYQIDIDRRHPIHVAQFPVSPQQRTDIIKQAKTMLDQDIIEPSRSPWSSPIILLKKSESKGGGFRFVTDFRQINDKIKNWVNELPLISEYLKSRAGFKIFTTLDANQGFFQVPIREEDKEITSFIVPSMGSFQYKVMPMGSKCSSSTFQALMDRALGSFKYTAALVFLDDILIAGVNFQEIQVLNNKCDSFSYLFCCKE